MKKIKWILIALLAMLVSSQLIAVPENLAFARHAVLKYVSSGQYMRDMSKQFAKATDDLTQALEENAHAQHKKRLAVVFDIDETSLSNLSYMIKNHFCENFKKESVFFEKGIDPAIPPALTFYHYAVKHDVAVFFITGRPEKMRAGTVRNLKHVGFKQFVKLYMTPKGYYQTHHSAVPFKSAERKAITNAGYTIVVNVGDQYSDLKGGFSEYSVKLPDPFYYIP